MAQDSAFQRKIQRIGEMVEQLESSTDPNMRALARELLESLMALHGAALDRILELVSESRESGESIIRKCGHDELVSSVLLLYGLHPEDLPTRLIRALEKIRKQLEPHGAKAELVEISENGAITLRLHVKANGCGSTAATLKSTVEAAMQNAAPDALSITIEETGAALTQSGFVSLAQLQSTQTTSVLPTGPAQEHGD